MIPGRQKQITMLAFIVVFGLIYPFIAYIRKEAYLSKSFDENRDIIMKVFDAANYKLIDEKDNKLFFRPESKLIRFMRMMEDAVIVDYSGNPLILSGMRKEIYRLAKHVEYMSSRQNEII
jgi:hypothetical protein